MYEAFCFGRFSLLSDTWYVRITQTLFAKFATGKST